MSIKDWSPEKMLQVQFTKELRRGVLNNAKLGRFYNQILDFLTENEICIVCVTADDETKYYLTDRRVISMSDVPITVIWYVDVRACDLWFPDGSGTVCEWENDDVKDKIRVKAIYFSRILVTYLGDNQILFTGLGESTNTIYNFFQWLAEYNTPNKQI